MTMTRSQPIVNMPFVEDQRMLEYLAEHVVAKIAGW
jgi:hypothetical protein